MADLFQTPDFSINQWDVWNFKIWDCNDLWCAIHDQNRAKKWSDFDENWCVHSPHFKPKTHQFLLKSDNFKCLNSKWKQMKNHPISIKFGVVLVWSVVMIHTNFHQNPTNFWPCFGRESHTRGVYNLKIWYFKYLTD